MIINLKDRIREQKDQEKNYFEDFIEKVEYHLDEVEVFHGNIPSFFDQEDLDVFVDKIRSRRNFNKFRLYIDPQVKRMKVYIEEKGEE